MWKKIIFFSITIIFGLVAALGTLFTFYDDNKVSYVKKCKKAENYSDILKMDYYFYDSNYVFSLNMEQDKMDLYVFPGLEQVSKKGTRDGKEVSYASFADTYIFLFTNIDQSTYVDNVMKNDTKVNNSSLIVNNGDKTYAYDFVISGDNPRDMRNVLKAYGYFTITISKSIVDEKLGGEITNISFKNNNGDISLSKEVSLKYDNEFFSKTSGLIEKNDECILAKDETGFKEYYNNWLKEYEKTYSTGFFGNEMFPASIFWKTAGVMALYVVCCILLGFLLLNKNGFVFWKKK